MLVLSAAVLVIVIDARDVGRSGWRAGVSRQDAKFAKGLARGGVTRSREGHGVWLGW